MNNDIERLKEIIAELQAQLAHEEAYEFLSKLNENATFYTPYLPKKNGAHVYEVFGYNLLSTSLPILPRVKSGAKHFKDMDTTQQWPSWRAEAYKAAKIVDEWRATQRFQ